MLRFLSYNIVFQEVPGEVTLAINLSNCPNGCKGCHSPHLQEDIGERLHEKVIDKLLARYGDAITCVCFMGGDADPQAVERLSLYIRKISRNHLKTAWYSGKPKLPEHCDAGSFDYIKLGPYVEKLGGLDSPDTNQRFYKVEDGEMKDFTARFSKKSEISNMHGFNAK
jgi:anaerobic ribonucleoside-triphosphate reductase activating protein